MLNSRQIALYKHRCDIWKVPKRVIGAVTPGKPSAEVRTLTTIAHPCIYHQTPNIDSETEAGRLKEFTMLVLDVITMEANSDISDADILVNTTILADGSKSNAWGTVHRIEGAPTINDSLGNRRCNNLFVSAMSMEHPPPEIAAHYGLPT